MRRIWDTNIILNFYGSSGVFYKAPMNLNYWYNFGFIALIFLIVQIVTGIFLAMFYLADSHLTFGRVLDICYENHYGWWFKSVHSNGASYFFFIVYLHMAKNIYYGSYLYPRQWLWVSGAFIWLLMIITAFLGYMLPWGQMSFWGAVVITNLIASIPFIGGDLIYLLWGGWTLGDITLKRFFALHFFLPFVILIVCFIHILLLHENGSSNPLGVTVPFDCVPFMPYYLVKDILFLIMSLIIFSFYVYFRPELLGHADNFLIANHLVTPAHIVPEWYFLPIYGILRSIPHKNLGILASVLYIFSVFILPFICKHSIIRSGVFRPFYSFFCWLLFLVCILLGWVGGAVAMAPYLQLGRILTFLYFFIIFVIFPLIGYLERLIYLAYIIRNKKK